MITVLSSPKPGSGVSTTAALVAIAVAQDRPTHLVDLCGDQTALLGTAEHAPDSTRAGGRLTVHHLADHTPGEQMEIIWRLARGNDHIVIDAGAATHPINNALPTPTIHRWVLRPCFLALRRAAACPTRPDEVIMLDELGRALRSADIENVTGVAVTATIEIHPQIARACDAGLLLFRPPRTIVDTLATFAASRKAV